MVASVFMLGRLIIRPTRVRLSKNLGPKLEDSCLLLLLPWDPHFGNPPSPGSLGLFPTLLVRRVPIRCSLKNSVGMVGVVVVVVVLSYLQCVECSFQFSIRSLELFVAFARESLICAMCIVYLTSFLLVLLLLLGPRVKDYHIGSNFWEVLSY